MYYISLKLFSRFLFRQKSKMSFNKKPFHLSWVTTKNNTLVKITLQHWSALIDDLRLIYNCSSKLFIWRHNYTYNCLSVHFIPFFFWDFWDIFRKMLGIDYQLMWKMSPYYNFARYTSTLYDVFLFCPWKKCYFKKVSKNTQAQKATHPVSIF